jgi:hypothetical protein
MITTSPIDVRLVALHAAAMADGISSEDFAETSMARRWTWRFLLAHALTTRTTWRNEQEADEVLARWDQRRMLRITGQATGPTKRLGRL